MKQKALYSDIILILVLNQKQAKEIIMLPFPDRLVTLVYLYILLRMGWFCHE